MPATKRPRDRGQSRAWPAPTPENHRVHAIGMRFATRCEAGPTPDLRVRQEPAPVLLAHLAHELRVQRRQRSHCSLPVLCTSCGTILSHQRLFRLPRQRFTSARPLRNSGPDLSGHCALRVDTAFTPAGALWIGIHAGWCLVGRHSCRLVPARRLRVQPCRNLVGLKPDLRRVGPNSFGHLSG